MGSVGSVLLMNHSPVMSVLRWSLHRELWTRGGCRVISQGQRARDPRRRRNELSPEQQLICTQWCLIVWLLLALAGCLCVNTEAPVCFSATAKCALGGSAHQKIAWDPWFHQKAIYLNIYQAGLPLKHGQAARLCCNMTDDGCSTLLTLCLWLTCYTAH